jgi:large subunit ribosomal protein L22
MRYSFTKRGEQFAFAQRYNIDASFKDLCQVCRAIRGKSVSEATVILDNVSTKKRAIEYRTYNKHIGSRHELGGKKGRYPVKAAKVVKKILLNAVNNAKVKQVDELSLKVVHASANKQNVLPRMSSKGKRMRANYETAKVEIVLTGDQRKIAEVTVADKKPKKVKDVVETKAEEIATASAVPPENAQSVVEETESKAKPVVSEQPKQKKEKTAKSKSSSDTKKQKNEQKV